MRRIKINILSGGNPGGMKTKNIGTLKKKSTNVSIRGGQKLKRRGLNMKKPSIVKD